MSHPTTPTYGVPITDPTLHLPRILCLHGGGTNSRIFRAQCRIIRAHLQRSFRLVFADAPYLSKPGPDVTSVYADWGPFRSWLKPVPGGAQTGPFSTPPRYANAVVMPVHESDAAEVISAIDASLAAPMRADDAAGASGEWIGLLGFSQGARMAASLLLREQHRVEALAGRTYRSMAAPGPAPLFSFAVLLAGSGPLVALEPDFRASSLGREREAQEVVLRLPTVHVHGLLDGGLDRHRELRRRCCARESAAAVEWEGGHRVPIKAKDVAAVVAALAGAYQLSRALQAR